MNSISSAQPMNNTCVRDNGTGGLMYRFKIGRNPYHIIKNKIKTCHCLSICSKYIIYSYKLQL